MFYPPGQEIADKWREKGVSGTMEQVLQYVEYVMGRGECAVEPPQIICLLEHNPLAVTLVALC